MAEDELKEKREEKEKGEPEATEPSAEAPSEDIPQKENPDKDPDLTVMTISMAEDGSGLRLSWAAGMNMHDARGVLKNADSILELTMVRQAIKAEFQHVMTGVRPAKVMPGKGGVSIN